MAADHFSADSHLLSHMFLRQSSTLPEVDEPRMELRSAWTRHPLPFAVRGLFL